MFILHSTADADFRTIPLGDIDLQCEIRLDVRLNVVDRWRERTCVQRIYTTKIEGRTSDMTVAMYQGNTAEEEWREGVSILSALRYKQALAASKFTVIEFAWHPGIPTFSNSMAWRVHPVYMLRYTMVARYWIRPSTGRLCLDFIPRDTSLDVSRVRGIGPISRPEGINSFNTPNREAEFISSITLDQYDTFCYGCFGKQRDVLISTPNVARLGALVHFPDSWQQKAPVEIASVPALLDLAHCSWPWIDVEHFETCLEPSCKLRKRRHTRGQWISNSELEEE
ncbi:hypothetical protein C8R45DRAFT_1193456, partial [Mycena sanguinolenta]